MNTSNFPIIIITGPTGVGKTAVAIQLASEINGEIISADSRQIYNTLDIGTGKPNKYELNKIRHYLISTISPTEIMTAEKYSEMAMNAYLTIASKNKKCLLVGGTGLWIKAFIDGLSLLPPGDTRLRNELNKRAENMGNNQIYKELYSVDPESAQKLFPEDQVRIIRCLEIYYLTGEKASELKKRKSIRTPLPAIWIGLNKNREQLYEKAERRIENWISNGWVEEVKLLMKNNYAHNLPAFQAIGYIYLEKYLKKEYSLDQALEFIKRDTRHYIKRQLTWFKNEKRLVWLDNIEVTQTVKNISQIIKTHNK